MSLLVHLPLMGDLRNNGLAGDITMTNHGATVNNTGKLGQCYEFDGTDDRIFTTDLVLGNMWSIAIWFKDDATTTTWGGICTLNSNGSDSDLQFGIYVKPSESRLQSSANGRYNSQIRYDPGRWNHIVNTFDGTTCKTYINGNHVNSFVGGSFLQRSNLTIGGRSTYISGAGTGAGALFKGCLNDFRLYNHVLSNREIKELAKGMVAHWKLDENISVLNNAYSYPTFDTSAAAGGWFHWGYSGNQGSYAQNTDKQYIYNKSQTYSHMISDGASASAGANYLVYQNPAFEGGYRSLQCICKEVNGAQINESIFYPTWNARDGGAALNKWTSITPLGDGFYLCKCEGIHQNGSNDLIGFYVTVGNTVYISEAYCENDREVCSDIFWQDEIGTIHDSSGYCHDGTVNDSLTCSTDTARYSSCCEFDGVNQSIALPSEFSSLVQDTFTMNLWFKKDELGSKNYETLIGGPSGFEIDTRAGSATTLSLYMASVRGGNVFSPFNLGQWYMVSLVNDGTNELYYIDGELVKTITKKAMPTGTYYIGAWRISSSQNYKGKISDVRVYATALSADDIKELYNTSASIDNRHHVFAREFIET